MKIFQLKKFPFGSTLNRRNEDIPSDPNTSVGVTDIRVKLQQLISVKWTGCLNDTSFWVTLFVFCIFFLLFLFRFDLLSWQLPFWRKSYAENPTDTVSRPQIMWSLALNAFHLVFCLILQHRYRLPVASRVSSVHTSGGSHSFSAFYTLISRLFFSLHCQ